MSFHVYALSDPQAAGLIVESIPDTWSGISGELVASDKMSSHMLFDTSVYFCRQLIVEGAVIPEENLQTPVKQVDRLFFGQRLPREIRFQKAGIGSRRVFALALLAVRQCMRHAYHGSLLFAHSFPRAIESKCRATVCFRLGPYSSRSANGVLRPHIELSWFPKYGGQLVDIAVIDAACRSAGLELISEVGEEPHQAQSTA